MHDDLIDACNWAVAQGYVDAKKIAIVGGSYGGYAALAAVTFTPEYFACAVDIVGPSNLKYAHQVDSALLEADALDASTRGWATSTTRRTPT